MDTGAAGAGLPLTIFLNTSCCTLHSLVDYIEYLAVEVGGVALLHRQVGRHGLVELRLELLTAAGEAGEQEENRRLLHGCGVASRCGVVVWCGGVVWYGGV